MYRRGGEKKKKNTSNKQVPNAVRQKCCFGRFLASTLLKRGRIFYTGSNRSQVQPPGGAFVLSLANNIDIFYSSHARAVLSYCGGVEEWRSVL